MSKSKKHLHTLERSAHNKQVYRCIDPDCTYFQRVEFIVGKRAACKCGNEFIVDRQQAIKQKNKNLTCLDCSKSNKAKKLTATKNILEDLFNEMETKLND